ncbi:DUF3575 domain-containing protein [Longitalea arenae]|uniref:DUF3575 domain-containing protein n=1 Tax=Longitalea arenae TaxID=2812558 RepID=UPI0019687DC3|nr:DUF3575 domain-containing protein [Longitalea arenae]
MVRFYLQCLLLLLVAGRGSAQPMSYRGLSADTGTIYLRHNPLGWADLLDNNVNLGAEYRLNKNWSATMDAGFIFYSQYFSKTRQATGWLFRPGIRLYPGKYKSFFIDLQLHYKEVTYHVKDWIERDVVQGVASYEELTRFRYKKTVTGAHLMIGGRKYLTSNRRFLTELYFGLGLHFKEEGPYHQPANSRYDRAMRMMPQSINLNEVNANNAPRKWILLAVPWGLRIIYRLR